MTTIEWTRGPDGTPGKTWNPVVGCSRVSPGCEHCYAEVVAHRKMSPQHHGLTVLGKHGPRWTGEVRFLPERLAEPLSWRKPRRVFVNSMSDLFHEKVTDEQIAEVFGVMAVAGARDGLDDASAQSQAGNGGAFHGANDGHFPLPGGLRLPRYRSGPHTFQVLTKRPARMQALLSSPAFRELVSKKAYVWAHDRRDAGYLADCISARNSWIAPGRAGRAWPLSNVWLGVSVEDQRYADERIPLLLETPAAIRFVSYEPALGPVDFRPWLPKRGSMIAFDEASAEKFGVPRGEVVPAMIRAGAKLDWIIWGGESGPGARTFEPAWGRSTIEQCRDAQIPSFGKQLGARVGPDTVRGTLDFYLQHDPKGGNWDEWPLDLRVREFPEARC